jgi:hypothetical protein
VKRMLNLVPCVTATSAYGHSKRPDGLRLLEVRGDEKHLLGVRGNVWRGSKNAMRGGTSDAAAGGVLIASEDARPSSWLRLGDAIRRAERSRP